MEYELQKKNKLLNEIKNELEVINEGIEHLISKQFHENLANKHISINRLIEKIKIEQELKC
ncbi:MAG: hypothetical protein LBC64_09135 [Fibromonadaceae bacterium]|jgi:hypothetical protein|nr:hypothetical protein [Fibromonadaceae bacterium]